MTLVLGPASAEVTALVDQLSACHVDVPAPDVLDAVWSTSAVVEAWRAEVSAGPPAPSVVVAVGTAGAARRPLADMDLATWLARAEHPFLLWTAALGAAVARCADGGSIVAVVDRPATLDSAGWSPESGVADAVEALARSLARSEGPRGVRVNVVTTARRFAGSDDLGHSVLVLPHGRDVDEIAGLVRMLLAAESQGLTGAVLAADRGRSFR